MKGMTNNQIIMNEAAKLDPAALHAIATAHHTPEQIAAMAANAVTTDENGDEQPATIADVEIILAAAELHTFDHWKKEGKSVKKGETHLIECYLWKYTTRPSKAQREAAEAEGKEAAPAPHFYPTKSHLFSCLQVHDAKQATAGRFGSVAAIMEYNKKLAAERKAAKAAAEQTASTPAPIITEEHHELPELVHVDPLPTKKASKPAATKAAAEVARPAPVVVEERHELPELVHVEPLPTKPAPKKPRTTKKPAADVAELKKAERKAMHEFMAVPETDRAGQAATLEAWRKATATRKAAEKAADEAPAVIVSMEELEPVFEKWYSNFYRTHDDNDSKEYREAVKTFDQKSKNDPEFSAIVQQFTNYRCDFISSDREAAAFVMALDELNHKHNAPEMVPSVQQLDFASIAAGVLA